MFLAYVWYFIVLNNFRLAYSLAFFCPLFYCLLPYLQFWIFKMYNFHGHPWAKILNKKFGKRKPLKTAIQNLRTKMLGEKFKEEKYLKDFFKRIDRNKKYTNENNDFEMKLLKWKWKGRRICPTKIWHCTWDLRTKWTSMDV